MIIKEFTTTAPKSYRIKTIPTLASVDIVPKEMTSGTNKIISYTFSRDLCHISHVCRRNNPDIVSIQE
jgi:hypothetical protein